MERRTTRNSAQAETALVGTFVAPVSPASAGYSLHPASAGVLHARATTKRASAWLADTDFSNLASPMSWNMDKMIDRTIQRRHKAEASRQRDAEAPLQSILHSLPPTEAGGKEEPAKDRLKNR